MTGFNLKIHNHRVELAKALEDKLISCGFSRENLDERREKVYSRPIRSTGMHVVVYTSIVGDCVRFTGKDAIRVVGMYRNGTIERGIISNTRVNRVGEINSIIERTYERMRLTWKKCNNVDLCRKCGAPKFTSKNGNKVCAEICWKRG